MLKIAFVNMPFAQLRMPAFGATQLREILRQRFGDEVETQICYVNQDCAHYLGFETYEYIVDNLGAANTGFGDWLFRGIAFPELEDNAEGYFKRFFPQMTGELQAFKDHTLERRQGLADFLDGIIDRYRLDQCDFVGFTSMFSQNCACFALARRIKDRNPKVVTLLGGANCETPMGEELASNVPQIDFVFSGPALVSLPEFLEHHARGDHEAMHKVAGVLSRRNLGRFGGLGSRGKVGAELPIDHPIPLDFDDFLDALEHNFPGGKVAPILLFETSRGCWWGERAHCTFCGLNGDSMGYRAMKPPLAVELITSLFRYADRCKQYHSVDNILPMSYFEEVLPKLNPPEDVSLFYEIKANLKEELVELMGRARIKMVQPGIESLSSSTLKLMKKGSTAFVNLALLKNCSLYDVYPAWNLLVGFPGEKSDVYQKYLADLPLLVHLPPPSGVYPVRFDRFSPYFTNPEPFGLKLEPYDFYKMIYPFSDESLARMAYYFMDRNYRAEYFTDMVKWLAKMRAAVVAWGKLWTAKGGPETPQLCFKDGGSVIVDSRFGPLEEFDVGEVGRAVLEELELPRKAAALASRFEHLPGFDAEQELARLAARRLLFKEGDQYMSLVLKRPPVEMSYFIQAAAA